MVIAAAHSLYQLSPLIGMVARGGGDLDWIVALFASVSVAQLLAGIAIAIGSPHARIAVLAWTLVSIASATFGREVMAEDVSTIGLSVMYVEALAGPLIAWLALAFAGEASPSPVIPRARVVSAEQPSASSSDVLDTTRERRARRPRIGVLLIGLAIVGLAGTLLWHLPMLSMILRSNNVASGLVSEGLFFGHAIAVALLALRAGRRLLDSRVAGRLARNAVLLYLLVDIGGDLLRIGAQIIYHLVETGLSSDVMTMLLAQWIAGTVFGLVIPAFVWFYVKPALDDAPASDADDETTARADLATLPAWAMLWFAPYLVSRVLLVKAFEHGVLAPQIVMVIVIVCATLGVLHVLAGLRALQRTADDASTRAAHIASTISLVIAVLFVLVWCVAMLAMDPLDRLRSQLPSMPLAQLVACSAIMVWALGKRR